MQNSMINLDADSCQLIKQNLSDRAARIIIEAIYTVTDATYDFPSHIQSIASPMLPSNLSTLP